MTPSEFNLMDPALEGAVKEIRDDAVDPAVIEAAAARVWANIAGQVPDLPGSHIRNCADFQALIPALKSGSLPAARATLLKDHLHECVACRRVYEGKVVVMPTAQSARRVSLHYYRWAAAAAVIVAAGVAYWMDLDPFGRPTGRAIVQTVNGSLYEISAAGIRPLAAGQDLADGVEIRTAKDSTAMLQLRDGSVVELRERSGFSTSQAAADLTVHLDRGSIIVQAARRRKGHLNVATADCRVAVTGTVFSVSSGVKGSRVAVIEGEVRVSQNNQEKILRPGDQTVTSEALGPLSVKEEISWSSNRSQLEQQIDRLTSKLQQIPLPGPRYSSKLLGRLPASTVFYASIPNLAAYLGDAQSVFARSMAENPELRAMISGRVASIEPLIEKLRAASEYLGDEIVIAAFARPDGKIDAPVLLAEMKREGFPEFLGKQIPTPVETRGALVVFGPHRPTVDALAAALEKPSGGFETTPFHTRIGEAYRDGAGFLLCADLSHMRDRRGPRYIIAGQKEVNQRTELRATVGFDGPRTGIAAWLADPAPMGSLDYVSPEATLVTAFVVKNPSAMIDELVGVARPIVRNPGHQIAIDLHNDLVQSLGGEFSLSIDGAVIPVPSWKLVAEVYDPSRAQSALQKVAEAYSAEATKSGRQPLRTAQETVEGRVYHMIASPDPNPLLEVHYTFANGYLIAGPSRAVVSRALQVKTAGTSIRSSNQFLALQPRDRYTSFSALVYQNLGTTLAPIAGLLGSFVPQERGAQKSLQGLGNMKPTLIAAYGEPDRITVAGTGNVVSAGLTGLISGNLSNVVGSAIPLPMAAGRLR